MSVLFICNPEKQNDPIIKYVKKEFKRKNVFLKVTNKLEEINNNYKLVILLSLKKVIKEEYLIKANSRVILFHSSDLPEGRGWAPIYETIFQGKKNFIL